MVNGFLNKKESSEGEKEKLALPAMEIYGGAAKLLIISQSRWMIDVKALPSGTTQLLNIETRSEWMSKTGTRQLKRLLSLETSLEREEIQFPHQKTSSFLSLTLFSTIWNAKRMKEKHNARQKN